MKDIESNEIPAIFRCPQEGCTATTDELMNCDAGRAYLVDQDGEPATDPVLKLETCRRGVCAQYEIYQDGSLWYINPAEDQIWSDAREFVRESLIPILAAEALASRAAGYQYECLDRMDLEMILWYVLKGE